MESHSVRFVEKLKKLGRNITLDIFPDCDHCDLTLEYKEKYRDYYINEIINHA